MAPAPLEWPEDTEVPELRLSRRVRVEGARGHVSLGTCTGTGRVSSVHSSTWRDSAWHRRARLCELVRTGHASQAIRVDSPTPLTYAHARLELATVFGAASSSTALTPRPL